jgi:hypothetical protein
MPGTANGHQKGDRMTQQPPLTIPPPARPCRRAGSWSLFLRRFEPLPAPRNGFLWDPWELPRCHDFRRWWTVVNCDGTLLAFAGRHFANRYAHVRCRNRWGGDAAAHPQYLYG